VPEHAGVRPAAPAPAPASETVPDHDLAPRWTAPRSPAAEAHLAALEASGLSRALATSLVREAFLARLPFSSRTQLKRQVRLALARRLPVAAGLDNEARALALVGPPGAGKTRACVGIALAHAAVGQRVAVVALGATDAGHALVAALEPAGVPVIATGQAAEARAKLDALAPALTLVDTRAPGPGEATALAADLRTLGVAEVHLALAAHLSIPAATELAARLAPLAPTHAVLTHADGTTRCGGALELTLRHELPVAYVTGADGVELADPLALAERLLP
jgi:flagellar biosynthesis GTPase FlhF